MQTNTTTKTKSQSKNLRKITQAALRIALCGVVLSLLGLTACSSVKEYVDKAPVKARTFSFLNTGNKQFPSYAEERQQAHAAVQQALINNLATKGVSYTQSGGDVTVGYLIVVGNNANTTSLNSYFGYTEDTDAIVQKVHKEQTGSDARGYFEAGTLVIDFIEPATSKLLQRRTVQAQLLRNLPTESRIARLQSLVDQTLKDVPVSH